MAKSASNNGNLGVKPNAGVKPALIHTPSNVGGLGRKTSGGKSAMPSRSKAR